MSRIIKIKLALIKYFALCLGLKATQVQSQVAIPFPTTREVMRGYQVSMNYTVYVSPKVPLLMVSKTEGNVIYLKGNPNAPHNVN